MHGAGPDPGQQHGYMDFRDAAERAEAFEVKLRYDPRYSWPERGGLRDAVGEAFAQLHSLALDSLTAIARASGLNDETVAILLDASAQPRAVWSEIDHLSECSNTALRIWSYAPRCHGSGAASALPAHIDWHTDNSLLTVSPPGSAVGLVCRRPCDCSCILPEAHLREDECIVFCGDALSFLTAGVVPALMHAVRASPAKRLSMPLFLRAKRNVVLAPMATCAAPKKPTSPNGMLIEELTVATRVTPAPIVVRDLERNADGQRASWPWKRHRYYCGATWHSDSEGQIGSRQKATTEHLVHL